MNKDRINELNQKLNEDASKKKINKQELVNNLNDYLDDIDLLSVRVDFSELKSKESISNSLGDAFKAIVKARNAARKG